MRVTQVRRSRLGVFGVCVGGSLVWLSACGPSPQPQEETRQPTQQEIQEATLIAPTVPPAVSVSALMVALVDHAAHEIWDVPLMPPKSDQDWTQLEYHAIQLAASGTLISVGGSGPSDPGWARLPAWRQYAQSMTDSGVKAIGAARSRDVKAFETIGNALTPTCEGCHKEFKPDAPTEGLLHTPHYAH